MLVKVKQPTVQNDIDCARAALALVPDEVLTE
jgi:hypothetical protein